MKTRGRELLVRAAAAVAAAGTLPAPAIAQGIKELKMVTSWPKGTPGPAASAQRLAQSISAMSDGRLKVTVHPAGSLVKAFEVFDAVAAGVADMYHSIDYYFETKSPALNFFAAVPYGMTADELCAWIDFGGGQALWDEVDVEFNIKPLMAGNSGVQMGGWFNKEVNTPEDFKGLALSHDGPRRRGLAPPGRHRRDDTRRRDHHSPEIRRDRCQRVGWASDGHRDGAR